MESTCIRGDGAGMDDGHLVLNREGEQFILPCRLPWAYPENLHTFFIVRLF